MIDRLKVVDVELDAPPQPLEEVDGYEGLRALVRLHGTPLGHVEVPLPGNGLSATDLRRILLRRLTWPVIQHHLRDMVESPLPPGGLSSEELLSMSHPAPGKVLPLITVAVCTRDRVEPLRICLDALMRLDYPHLDILVVDNAPSSDATANMVRDFYPRVRYACEPRPGLDWARNKAIAEAHGEIVAYADDDVAVDLGWAAAIAAAFEDPQVMAVTGLVVPYELETKAQILFEQYGGFGRNYRREYWRIDREGGERSLEYLGAGKYGTGANMAYRRSLFGRIGSFDPALDVGTVTNGGGDLEMFFRVLKEGYLLTHEPAAIIRHRHRRNYAQLRVQLANNGIGFFSFLVRTALVYPDARGDAVRFGLWWFWRWSLKRLVGSFISLRSFPSDLVLAELWGSLVGLGRYPKARRRAARVAASGNDAPVLSPMTALAPKKPVARKPAKVGVRTVDLCQSLRDLDDIDDHAQVRVFVTLDGRPIGSVDVANRHQPLSAARLREAMVDQLGLRLLGQGPELYATTLWEDAKAALRRRYLPAPDRPGEMSERLPDSVPVSIVVATYDRPDDLRECLRCISVQETTRTVELVVVDNNPASGLTPTVVADFPGVVLVTEMRQGLSYARNKGIIVSCGEIVIATDDDVVVPPDWLEKLVAPFVWADVMAVTGTTLPLELETEAQRRFETYGGLGRGFVPKEVDGEWFDSFRRRAVPTWELGATANAAFRADIFAHPEIGLMDEALGAGSPTGCNEDTYLFYKVLKAGYTIAYAPSAYVWHKHRREMRALRKQLYSYGKGHVAYHLTTLLRDRDRRAAIQLAVRLPESYLWRIASSTKRLVLRRDRYPFGLILVEGVGNLAGPWSLWRSYQRVKREGRSGPYTLVSQRATADDNEASAVGSRNS